MFWAIMCPSPGETKVFTRNFVLVILHGLLSSMHDGHTVA